MNKIYLGFLISILSPALQGQSIKLEWVKSMGGISSENGNSITTDVTGNVYVTGYYEGTVDFDPGADTFNLTSVGSSDVFIQKLDATGNFIWAKSFGGTSAESGYSIATDALNNVYATGYYYSDTVDFDPGVDTFILTSTGSSDVFLQKLDSAGNFIWAKSIGGASVDKANSIVLDASGNVYVTGTFRGTADFDPSPSDFSLTSIGIIDVFILKLDSVGNFIWAKSVGGESGQSITIDVSGNVDILGYYSGTEDFNPGVDTFNLTSIGSLDIFILKLDSAGNFIWSNSMGGTSVDEGLSIATDAFGNVYSTGYYIDSADFDPGVNKFMLISNGGYDVFIQKLDSGGNFIWAKSIGGASSDYGYPIYINGGVYITGYYFETADFDPGTDTFNLISMGSSDVFIQKLDSGGNFIWAKSIGGTMLDQARSITIDGFGNVYLTGDFKGMADFNPGAAVFDLTSNGWNDVFILKLTPCTPNAGIDLINACDPYTWIDGNTYTSTNNSATYTLTNAVGCDSVVTLDLTINTVDVSVTASGPNIIANAVGATYRWMDCGNSYAVVDGETSREFTGSTSGVYAVEVTENSCTDTSACIAITVVGIEGISLFNNVSVYPNPNQGLVNIYLGTLKGVWVRVFNVTGLLVYYKENINALVHRFALNEAPGVYIVEVSTEEENRHYKLVKD